MNDVLLPQNLRHARTSLRYLDSTGVSRNTFTGALVTAAKGGDRLGLTLEFTKHGGKSTEGKSERALLRSFLTRLRGRQNRTYIQDLSYGRRGSFPTSELLANNTFANGTTGWSIYSSMGTLTATDRVLRATRTTSDGSHGLGFGNSSALTTLTQYAPYVARVFLKYASNSASQGLIAAGTTATGAEYGVSALVGQGGMATLAFVPYSVSTVYLFAHDGTSTFAPAGDYCDFSYISLSRCALVDNGINLGLRSDEFDNAAWVKTRATVSANATTAPDGTSSADSIVESNAASNTHLVEDFTNISVGSGAADYCFAVALKAGTRITARLLLFEATGNTSASAYFFLSGGSAGTVGTVASGANWASTRAVIRDMGNGWYYCAIVSRKTNAATQLYRDIRIAVDDGSTDSYSGDGSSNLYAWRATLAQSSVPVRLVQTTSAAVSPTQTGSALYLKGLPVSTSGLLEIDDQVEVITSRGSELKLVTARLNSDAAGLGYLQFEPPLRTSPAANAPVIVQQPFGRFLFTGDVVGWDNSPGFWSESSAEFEEAI